VCAQFKRLLIALTSTLACGPLFAYQAEPQGSRPAFAIITQAEAASLDGAAAAVGSTVYASDVIKTDPTGSLRLRARGAQLYLLPASAIQVEKTDASLFRATLKEGTAGFSSGANDLVELVAADAIIRTRSGVPAHGRVTFVKAAELEISSIRGPFDITFEGVTQTIADGKSYEVRIEDDAAEPTPGLAGPAVTGGKRKLILLLISLAAASGVGYYINQELTESPSTPGNQPSNSNHQQ